MLFVCGGINEVLFALFTPQIGLFHVGKLDGGESGLLIFHDLSVPNDIVALAVEVVRECGFIAEVGTACETLILVNLQYRTLVVRKILKCQERFAALVTLGAETVTGTFLVSLSCCRIGKDLQAGRTSMVILPQMLGAVALDAEEPVRTYGAPEVIGSVLTLVGEVDHDSLDWFRLASSSGHVLVDM
jgi:hypothetical protein